MEAKAKEMLCKTGFVVLVERSGEQPTLLPIISQKVLADMSHMTKPGFIRLHGAAAMN